MLVLLKIVRFMMKLVLGSPFSTYRDAMKAVGYSKNSTVASKTIDTGKVVDGRSSLSPLQKGLDEKE